MKSEEKRWPTAIEMGPHPPFFMLNPIRRIGFDNFSSLFTLHYSLTTNKTPPTKSEESLFVVLALGLDDLSGANGLAVAALDTL